MDINLALTYFRQGGAAYLPTEEIFNLKSTLDAILGARGFYLSVNNFKSIRLYKNGMTFRQHFVLFLEDTISNSYIKKSRENRNFLKVILNNLASDSKNYLVSYLVEQANTTKRKRFKRMTTSIDSLPEGNHISYSLEEDLPTYPRKLKDAELPSSSLLLGRGGGNP